MARATGKRRWLSATVAALTAGITALTPAVASGAQVTRAPANGAHHGRTADLGAVVAHRLAGRAYPALRAFQRIADRNGGTRGYDQPGFAASADYVVHRLRQAHYRVWRQKVPYTDFVPDEERAVERSPVQRSYRLLMTRWVPSTPRGGITARVGVLPEGASGCTASDYAGFAGAIAVVPRGTCGYTAQQALAAQAGAVAFIVYYPTPSPDNAYRFIAFTPSDFTIPMGSISQREGEELIAQARARTVMLTVVLRAHEEQRVTENVLAETAGGRPDSVVMVGGHLDSVTEGPGINDNASTASAVLQTALALAPYQRKVVNKVRFAWWGAEELVDIGSDYYVAHLSAEERRHVRALVNGELLGSPNYVRHVWDGGPAGGHAIAARFEQFFDARGLPYEVVDPALVGSDHEPFEAVGIPIGGLDSGLLSVKTEAEQQVFGGRAGQLEDPCYHQACDRISNIDRSVLDADTQALGYVVGSLAVDATGLPTR
ncbi:MAG: M28 family peptidase [Frankiaceae bacterium]